MLNLSGVLDNQSITVIHEMVQTKFKDSSKFRTPESIILYEQGYLDRGRLLELCQEQYDEGELKEPVGTFIPIGILEMFKGTNIVPMQYIARMNKVVAIYVPEYTIDKPEDGMYDVEYVPTTLHYYIENYTRHYGAFKELLQVPGKVVLDMILEEAINKGVPDLTISNEEERVIVYYNRLKSKEMTNHVFPKEVMDEIIKVVTMGTPIASINNDNKPKQVGYEIDDDYRSRITISKVYYGHSLSIRILPNALFETTLEDLNINEEVIEFLRDEELNKSNGIRFIVGETMSGKNTTALAILKEIVDRGTSKVVSIEMPLEQKVRGVEQIEAEFIEEYTANIESLIHLNPDFVYITETRDETGLPIFRIANTGKRVLSTLHSNSVHDTVSRVVDVTGLDMNRIIQVLHSIIHQELVVIDNKLYPNTTFVYFDEDFKLELYDKPFGEVIRLIRNRVRGGLRSELLQD